MHTSVKKMCSVLCAIALLLTCFGPGLQSMAAEIVSGISEAILSLQSTRDAAPKADIRGLRWLINLANQVDVSNSSASQADKDAFQADLAAARTVEQNGSATADEINDAYNTLAESYNVLHPIEEPDEVYVKRTNYGAVFYDKVEVGLLDDYRNFSQQYEPLEYPYDTLYRSVTYSSTNPDVAVTEDGVLTPLVNKAVYTQIVVTITTYSGRVLSRAAYVTFAKIHVTGMSFDEENYWFTIDETPKIKYTMSPQVAGICTANIQDVVWSSNDPESVQIDPDGTLHFLKIYGPYLPTATIYVRAVDGGYPAICNVYVDYNRKALQAKIDEANQLDETLYTAESWQQMTQVLAQAIAERDKDYYDTKQERIDAMTAALDNAMRALEPLETIDSVVITHDGSPANKFNTVTVGTWSGYSNQTFSLGISVTPSDAAYQSVTWTSSDTNMTVNSDGTVTPTYNQAVAAQITATVTDYNGRQFSNSVYVAFVKVPVTGLTLGQSSLSLAPGDTYTLTYDITPKANAIGLGGATLKNLIWETSDPSVASIDNGVVTAVDGGVATITCTTMDGGYTASCSVAVTVDKWALTQAITNARAVSSEPYTAESYAALQEAIQAAEVIVDKMYAKTGEVDAAIEAIRSATNALQIRPADYLALYQAISAYEALDPDRYTPESYAAVQQAVNNVVYDLPYTDQTRVNNMTRAIVSAISQLVERPADYTAVNAAVAAFNDLLPVIYTPESYAAVQQAVNSVVYDLNYVEQARVDAMAQAINDAIAQLVERTADYTAVDAAVAAFEALNPNYYTPESYAAVQQAVNAVVYGLTYSEQERVDVMAQSINNTLALLVEVTADYSAVEGAISLFGTYPALQYTPESYAAVQQAIDAVVYGLPHSQQDSVDAMAVAIYAAIFQLVERAVPQLTPAEGCSSVVDVTNHFVYGVLPGMADVLPLFNATEDGSLAFTPAANGGGTGSTITLSDKYGDAVETFTLIVFGDVNGDVWYDGTDAYFVKLVVNGMISESSLSDAQRMAADCNHDGVIDNADVAILEQAGLLLESVDQTLPDEALQTNGAYLEYIGLIDQFVEIDEADEPAPEQPQEETAAQQGSIIAKILSFFRTVVEFLNKLFFAKAA